MRVLITGGAGFIGSHLADALLEAGHEVRVLDALVPQVHPFSRPAYLNAHVDLIVGDVRNPLDVIRALQDVDAVYHFAAAVGVGQSMYQPADYVSVNSYGTAVLMECMAQHAGHSVKRLIVASSMSVYGEGVLGALLPSAEEDHPGLPNVYALTKYDQERLCLVLGEAYGIPTIALRFFNVYGPRQALSNPYTGVIAIFASRLLNNKPPLIYDDGLQSRDFVSVYDIVQACTNALHLTATGVFNIGSGVSHTVLDVANALAVALGRDIAPVLTGTKRVGDIRHCFADITKAQESLGYEPSFTLEDGLKDLVDWLRDKHAVDLVEVAAQELLSRGLAY